MVLFAGLFHRVIAQSGCSLNLWAKGKRSAKIIAKTLGFESSNEADILEFLQDQPVDKILYAQDNIFDVIFPYLTFNAANIYIFLGILPK